MIYLCVPIYFGAQFDGANHTGGHATVSLPVELPGRRYYRANTFNPIFARSTGGSHNRTMSSISPKSSGLISSFQDLLAVGAFPPGCRFSPSGLQKPKFSPIADIEASRTTDDGKRRPANSSQRLHHASGSAKASSYQNRRLLLLMRPSNREYRSPVYRATLGKICITPSSTVMFNAGCIPFCVPGFSWR